MVKDNLAHQIVATPKDEIVIDEIPVKWCTVSLSEIIERGKRLEASVYDVEAKQAREIIADVLRQQSGFIGLTQRQKEQCEECYRELTPYRITSVLESGQATKQIGAYNFVNDAEKISEAIVIILYMLRCCLAHGDISPDESANEVYKYAYEVLCAPLRKLK